MMQLSDISITPEHFHGAMYSCRELHISYVSPEGTVWKVSQIDDEGVHVWNVNACGNFYNDVIPLHVFLNDWKQYPTTVVQ